ncbi:MAG: hypothetical protein AB7Q17_05840 [Phycisphaerae bacterium]
MKRLIAYTHRGLHKLTLLAGGTTLILGGCDPSIQATVEEGIIGVVNTGIGAFIGAFADVVIEAIQQQNMT